MQDDGDEDGEEEEFEEEDEDDEVWPNFRTDAKVHQKIASQYLCMWTHLQ